MAQITIADVEKVSGLSKLEFSGEEMEKFSGQFNKIIGFVEKISELDVGAEKPMTHAVEKINVTRDDVVKLSFTSEEIEAVAPKFADGSIIVPKIIEY